MVTRTHKQRDIQTQPVSTRGNAEACVGGERTYGVGNGDLAGVRVDVEGRAGGGEAVAQRRACIDIGTGDRQTHRHLGSHNPSHGTPV